MTFTCASCKEVHDLDQISFGADRPSQWWVLTEEERARSELSSDQCVMESKEGRHFFVRGCLDIPIRGSERTFTWGVWVSLREESFLEMSDHWEDPARTDLGPYFGWLSTALPTYPDTMFLKTMVHQRPVGERPLIELGASDHLLAVHQQEGIGSADLERMVMELLHDTEKKDAR